MDRFGDEVVTTGVETLLPIAVHRIRCQSNQREITVPFKQYAGRRVTVEDRYLHIDDHHFTLLLCARLTESIDQLLPFSTNVTE